jgi:hypothetical protein
MLDDFADGVEDYMNGFKCNVTSSTSNVALAKPQIPRRCGADPDFQKLDAVPGNCTYGAKQPFYWFQAEANNACPFFPPHTFQSHKASRCSKTHLPHLSITIFTILLMGHRMTSFKTPMSALFQPQGRTRPHYLYWLKIYRPVRAVHPHPRPHHPRLHPRVQMIPVRAQALFPALVNSNNGMFYAAGSRKQM